MLSAAGMSLIYSGGFGAGSFVVSKMGAVALGTSKTITAAAAASKLGASVTKLAASMNSKVVQSFRFKANSAVHEFSAVGQKLSGSRLSKVVQKYSKQIEESTKITSETVALEMVKPAVRKGEYADGKLFVVRGGPSALADGSTKQEPICLEFYENNLRLTMENCTYSLV
jgi:hypothetical protein